MRISAVQSIQPYNGNNKNIKFQGYVNGKYYKDSIIEKAKAAIKNTNWEAEMLAKKPSFGKDFLHWHGDSSLAGRIVAAIVSFGTTELMAAGIIAADVATDETDEEISQIKSCMIDLLKESKS